MGNDLIDRLSHWKLIGFLFIVSFFVLMFGNEMVSLTHPDEVFYAQTAKEMIHHHSWMTPYIFDTPQFEKPVLFYWLLIAAFKCFGVSAFAARFWPAIFGMLGVIVTYWIAFMFFQNKKTALFSGIVLCTSLIYLILSRAVLTDMVFSIWITVALAFFVYGYLQREKRDAAIVSFFVFCALAVLTKGLLGIVFPCGVVLAFLSVQKEWNYFKSWGTLAGIILFALIAVPWHAVMLKLYENRFVDEYWFNDHLRRVLEAEHAKSNTWYFYLFTLFTGMFPWSFFLIPAVYVISKKIPSGNSLQDYTGLKFLLIWIATVYVIVQSAQSKLASYILPAFPAMAIMLGYYFTQILEGAGSFYTLKAMRIISYGIAGLLGVSSIGSLIFARKHMELIPHPQPVYIFVGLALVCAFIIVQLTKRRQYIKTIFSIGCIPMVLVIFLMAGHTYAEPWVSCKTITEAFIRIDPTDHSVILSSKFYLRGVRFYTDRKTAVLDINGEGFFSPHPVPFLNTDEKVLQFLKTQPVTYCILKKSNVEDVKRIAYQDFNVEYFDPIADKYILKITRKGFYWSFPNQRRRGSPI